MKDLTERQHQVLEAIEKFQDDSCRPPTYRELGEMVGISSTNGVQGHLKALRKKGYLRDRVEDTKNRITLKHSTLQQYKDWKAQAIPLLKQAALIVLESAPHRYEELQGISELLEDNAKMSHEVEAKP